MVRRWAGRLDLVAPRDSTRFEERHVADSLRLLPLVSTLDPGPAIDVGSGVGLPGIPLAIAEPRRSWRLLERRRRRASFLEEVVRVLELDCEVLVMGAEEAASEPRLQSAHPLATARAVASPRRSFELLEPLVAPGGVGAVFVGPSATLPEKAALWGEGIAIIRHTRA